MATTPRTALDLATTSDQSESAQRRLQVAPLEKSLAKRAAGLTVGITSPVIVDSGFEKPIDHGTLTK